MHQYKLISRKGEGAFSEVLKAQSIKTSNYVAIKCMKTHFNSVEQVNQLREIQALRKVSPHLHIIKLLEILYDEPTGRLALVFELMDLNLYELVKDRKTYLPQSKVKYYMYQLFKAVDALHKKGIFHRDIKPENILISGDLVKLADLGSCRGMFGEHPYTEYISTRWYRSPECLMTDGYYDQKMDIWGAGCVMFEILTLVPLFPGKNELDMIHRIHNIIGTPPQKVLDRFKSHASHLDFNFPQKTGTGIEKMLPHCSADCIDLLKQLLTYDPDKRITAEQVLQHDYFREFVEHEKPSPLNISRTSLSMKQSASYRASQQNLSQDYEKSPVPHERSPLHQVVKKKSKKPKDPHGTASNKFPGLNVNVKVDEIFKQYHGHDTSTEDEAERTGILPPIRNQGPTFQLETKLTLSNLSHSTKKNDFKKHSHASFKPTPSNQYLYQKSQKSNLIAPEYLIVGKKAL
jgi:renal tumor antigen